MGRTAGSKLDEADKLHAHALRIRKHDAESADQLEAAARRKRRSAIKQMTRRPKPRKAGVVGGGRELDVGIG